MRIIFPLKFHWSGMLKIWENITPLVCSTGQRPGDITGSHNREELQAAKKPSCF